MDEEDERDIKKGKIVLFEKWTWNKNVYPLYSGIPRGAASGTSRLATGTEKCPSHPGLFLHIMPQHNYLGVLGTGTWRIRDGRRFICGKTLLLIRIRFNPEVGMYEDLNPDPNVPPRIQTHLNTGSVPVLMYLF